MPPGGRRSRQFIDPRLLRRAAAASFVLLRNEQEALPINPDAIGSLALLGPNAFQPTIQGGGSAGVVPVSVSTPRARAAARRWPARPTLTTAPGCQTWVMVPEPAPGSFRDPDTGEPGLRLEFRDADGTLIRSEHRDSASLAWWDRCRRASAGARPGGSCCSRPPGRPRGPHLIGAAGVGRLTIAVDGSTVADEPTRVPADPVEAMTRPGEVRAVVTLEAGREAVVRLDFRPAADGEGPLAVRLGIAADEDEDQCSREAVQAASEATPPSWSSARPR